MLQRHLVKPLIRLPANLSLFRMGSNLPHPAAQNSPGTYKNNHSIRRDYCRDKDNTIPTGAYGCLHHLAGELTGTMSGRRSYHEETRRQQLNEMDPPPSYSEAVNEATPFHRQDGLLAALTSPSRASGSSSQTTTLPTTQSIDLMSLGREISTVGPEVERQSAAGRCSGCRNSLAEPRTQVRAIGSTAHSAPALGRCEGTETQQRIIESQKMTIASKDGALATQDKHIKLLKQTMRAKNMMIEHRDGIIRRKNEDLESMSVRLAAAEAALRKKK